MVNQNQISFFSRILSNSCATYSAILTLVRFSNFLVILLAVFLTNPYRISIILEFNPSTNFLKLFLENPLG